MTVWSFFRATIFHFSTLLHFGHLFNIASLFYPLFELGNNCP